MHWAVYTRRFLNHDWTLLFVLPPMLSESEVADCVTMFDAVRDDGYKHYYYLHKMADETITYELRDLSQPYHG